MIHEMLTQDAIAFFASSTHAKFVPCAHSGTPCINCTKEQRRQRFCLERIYAYICKCATWLARAPMILRHDARRIIPHLRRTTAPNRLRETTCRASHTHTHSARLFAVVVCHAVWQREHSYSCINVYRTSSCASVCELRRLVAIIGYIAICASGGGRERVWFKGTVGRFIIKCRFIYGKSASVISNESWQFVWFFSERIALELLRKREVLWYFYCIYGYQLLLYSWFYSYVRIIKYSRN